MPPKRRSGRKTQSPAKAAAVVPAEQEEQGSQEEHAEQGEQESQAEQGSQAKQGEQESQEEQTEQPEEGENEAEAAIDLIDDQDMSEDALDQMLQFDDGLNDGVASNGVDESESHTDTEAQPSESVGDGDQEAAEGDEGEGEGADGEGEGEGGDGAEGDGVGEGGDGDGAGEEESTKQEGEETEKAKEDGGKGDAPDEGAEGKDTAEKKKEKTKEEQKSWFLTESYIKRNLVFKQYMRKEIGADIRLKTVLMFPVTLIDLQDTTLLSYIERSHRFLLNYNDRLKKHNTEGFLSMSFHTVKEADEAAEGLKTWREGMTVRRMHPPESVDKAMNDMKGFDPAMETHCMVFVKFLPEDATQEALDELIPGSTSVVIARNDDGVQRNYGYLTYATTEEAKAAAEKYKDIEMNGKKLLVVHYGTYIDPVTPTTAMTDTKRVHMLHQYRNLKIQYEAKRTTMVPSYKQQTEYRMEMLKSRLEKDAELRQAEKKPVLGLDQLPAKKAKIEGYHSSYVPNKLIPAPRPLAPQPMKRKNKPFQAPYGMGGAPRWQNQPMGGGMGGMGGGGMLGAGGMMGGQPDATVKAVNMLVGLISNQLTQQQPQQQPQQQQQQQWGGSYNSTGGSSYGGTQASYGSNTSGTGYGASSYSSGGSSGYQGNSSRWNQWGNSSTSGTGYGSSGTGVGNSYRGSTGGGYGSGTYTQGMGSGLGGQGGWNKNKRKSGGGQGGGQWKGKKGRWN